MSNFVEVCESFMCYNVKYKAKKNMSNFVTSHAPPLPVPVHGVRNSKSWPPSVIASESYFGRKECVYQFSEFSYARRNFCRHFSENEFFPEKFSRFKNLWTVKMQLQSDIMCLRVRITLLAVVSPSIPTFMRLRDIQLTFFDFSELVRPFVPPESTQTPASRS